MAVGSQTYELAFAREELGPRPCQHAGTVDRRRRHRLGDRRTERCPGGARARAAARADPAVELGRAGQQAELLELRRAFEAHGALAERHQVAPPLDGAAVTAILEAPSQCSPRSASCIARAASRSSNLKCKTAARI